MSPALRPLGGHLSGSEVSALVDGQVPGDAAARAWTHVAGCPGCVSAVERETWIKNRVGDLRRMPTPSLTQDLLTLPDRPERSPWGPLPEPGRPHLSSRARWIAGVGTVSAAVVVSLAATTGTPWGPDRGLPADPVRPAAQIGGPGGVAPVLATEPTPAPRDQP